LSKVNTKNEQLNEAVNVEPLVTLRPNTFINADCMDYLPKCPTGFFDLAIVDPQYGIGASKGVGVTRSVGVTKYKIKDWDEERPGIEYFTELRRISKNQIIFGGNYFADLLPASRCWIYWQKDMGGNYADGELAWTSFDRVLKQYKKRSETFDRIHPTQKPVSLYRWVLRNFAENGQLILDTHVGSGSSLIACKELGFDYVGFEIDEDYYRDASKRLAGAFRKYELNFDTGTASV
jgi:site-specific DNA-methyltransferase (adenine-specific)